MPDIKNKIKKSSTSTTVDRISHGIRDYIDNLRLFSRNIRLYLAASFLIGLTFSGYLLLLNLYLREQGSTESFIGTVLSSGALGMALMAIPAAMIIRKVKLKPILILSTMAYTISILLLTWLPVSKTLILISFFGGIFMTFYRVAAAPFFMRHSSPKERTYIFSTSFGVSLAASVVGSLFFGKMVATLTEWIGSAVSAYRWTFAFSIGLGFLAVIPFGLIKAAEPGKDATAERFFTVSVLKKRLGLYVRLFSPYFVVGSGAGLIIPFLNIYFRDRFGQPTDTIGYLFTLVHLTMFIGIMAAPILVKKLGMVRTMVSTQLVSIPFMIILAFSYNLPIAIAAFLIRGALMNMGHPIGSNFSMEVVSRNEHALVNALLMLGWTSSWMISTAIGGQLIEKYGYTTPMLLAVALYIVSSILYYVFFNKTEVKQAAGYKIITDRWAQH
jgi:MFS family permease